MGSDNSKDSDNICCHEGLSINNPEIVESLISHNSQTLLHINSTQNVKEFEFKYSNSYDFITDTECCMCYEDYHDDMILYMLPCDHIFHYKCLQQWQLKHATCPMCR